MIVVSFSSPERVAAFLQAHPLPFPVVADPSRSAYNAFALGRTSWRVILGARVLFRFLKALLRGRFPGKPAKGDDLLQLGGDFVLDRQRRLVYAHPSADPTDRPPVEELVRAVEALGE